MKFSLRATVFVFIAILTGQGLLFAQSGWAVRNQRAGGDELWGITNGPNGIVAVGANGSVLHSANGTTWVRRSSGSTDLLLDVAYGNGRYVAVGDQGRILSSVNGETWSNVPQTATVQRLNAIAYSNDNSQTGPSSNGFVAVGEGGTILTSSDGATWTAVASGTTRWLRGLAFLDARGGTLSKNIWVATGEAGTLLVSGNISGPWVALQSGTTADLESVASISVYGGGFSPPVHLANFGAAGSDGIFYRISIGLNSNGTTTGTVTPLPLGNSARMRSIVVGQRTRFPTGQVLSEGAESTPIVAFDDTGSAFVGTSPYTPDLTVSSNWKKESLPGALAVRGSAYVRGHESFYVVGANETILQRDQVFNGRMGNISARGLVQSGERALVAGFVVIGSTPKTVLIRGIGPTLAAFGISAPLPRPALTVFSQTGTVVGSNTAWGSNANPSALAATMAQAGAFALANGSQDSAVVLTLAPGGYTAQVAGVGDATGTALLEIYDLDPGASGTSRCINFSTRGFVAGGENSLVLGLTVRGPGVRTFLVRGVGPSLARYGITNPLADPRLLLASSQTETRPANFQSAIGNDSNAAIVAGATASVGAFALDAGGADGARVFTLPAGTYTFDVSSPSNATGVSLLEIYELPGAID